MYLPVTSHFSGKKIVHNLILFYYITYYSHLCLATKLYSIWLGKIILEKWGPNKKSIDFGSQSLTHSVLWFKLRYYYKKKLLPINKQISITSLFCWMLLFWMSIRHFLCLFFWSLLVGALWTWINNVFSPLP